MNSVVIFLVPIGAPRPDVEEAMRLVCRGLHSFDESSRTHWDDEPFVVQALACLRSPGRVSRSLDRLQALPEPEQTKDLPLWTWFLPNPRP